MNDKKKGIEQMGYYIGVNLDGKAVVLIDKRNKLCDGYLYEIPGVGKAFHINKLLNYKNKK